MIDGKNTRTPSQIRQAAEWMARLMIYAEEHGVVIVRKGQIEKAMIARRDGRTISSAYNDIFGRDLK